MLRIRFTAEDLLRVRIASAPAPLMELGMAIATLRRDDAVFRRWARRIRLPRSARPLLELIPPTAGGPVFLDPVSEDFDDGLDRVLSTPRDDVRAELARGCRPTPWTKGLIDGERDAWRTLERALRGAYDGLIEAEWTRVRASFHADVAWRQMLLSQEGLRAALVSICPGSRWDGATLEMNVPWEGERLLEGRGLTLLPSPFWTGGPRTSVHPDGSMLLVYPALTPMPLIEPEAGDTLGALVGQTRADVLRVLTAPRTTTELAGTLGISGASASEHARTLRRGGLVVTRRNGRAVTHLITPLGLRLLNAE
ncbi:transcriptional regulator [Actinoallomurus iriomotensis]|uniref:Transcriptional regulator n=2 Tax=Actinoallomurus iriomotensis TaxID=478107 RepID=A0A9W6S6W7_9ACTN|nr:transcriptional regulator [Actinoallomurus iriomotensis]